MRRSRPIGIVVALGVALGLTAAVAQSRYEAPAVLSAADVVPPELRQSPAYEIDDRVTTDGLVTTTGFHSSFGEFVAEVAGEDDRKDVSSTLLQPFLASTTKTAWTFTLNTEATYDWKAEHWSVPLHFVVSKVTRIGGAARELRGGSQVLGREPRQRPHGLGARFVMTFLFPK